VLSGLLHQLSIGLKTTGNRMRRERTEAINAEKALCPGQITSNIIQWTTLVARRTRDAQHAFPGGKKTYCKTQKNSPMHSAKYAHHYLSMHICTRIYIYIIIYIYVYMRFCLHKDYKWNLRFHVLRTIRDMTKMVKDLQKGAKFQAP
jgi:hypothetical protein